MDSSSDYKERWILKTFEATALRYKSWSSQFSYTSEEVLATRRNIGQSTLMDVYIAGQPVVSEHIAVVHKLNFPTRYF